MLEFLLSTVIVVQVVFIALYILDVIITVKLKSGRWEEACDGDGVVCSVCKEDFCTMIHDTNRFNYCPNCGAKMDGETE